MFPFIDITYNDLARFIWNDLFLPVANILIYIWDAFVQLIGFVLYIAINLIVTVFFLIMDLIGELHIMELFESLMEIVTPLVQLAISILQLLIKVGSDIIRKLIPIVVAILKVAIQVIKVLFKIVQWLLVTLFKLLFPLLKAVIAVVKFVIRVFLHKAASFSSRALLSMAQSLSERLEDEDDSLDAANRFETFELYSTAMRYYSVGQYEDFLADMEGVHAGLRSQDHFHETGEPLPMGAGIGGNYERHLYHESELDEHERVKKPKQNTPAPTTAQPGRARSQRRPLSVDHEDAIQRSRKALIDELMARAETEDPTGGQPWADVDYVQDEGEATDAPEQEDIDVLKHGNEWRTNKSREQIYAEYEPEDWWRIDLSWNMTYDQVFPRLKGRGQLRKPMLEKLTPVHTPERMHKRRVLATAYAHAIQQGYYAVHKRHIQHGRFSRYVAKGFKQATGHDSLEAFAEHHFGGGKYESVAHWLHSNIPDFTNRGIFKHMKEADPEHKTRRYFHDWVNDNYGPEGIPREYYAMWEAQERYMEEEDYLNSGNKQPSRPMPEFVHHAGNIREMFGPNKINPRRRELLAFEPFSLPLEFLVRSSNFGIR